MMNSNILNYILQRIYGLCNVIIIMIIIQQKRTNKSGITIIKTPITCAFLFIYHGFRASFKP